MKSGPATAGVSTSLRPDRRRRPGFVTRARTGSHPGRVHRTPVFPPQVRESPTPRHPRQVIGCARRWHRRREMSGQVQPCPTHAARPRGARGHTRLSGRSSTPDFDDPPPSRVCRGRSGSTCPCHGRRARLLRVPPLEPTTDPMGLTTSSVAAERHGPGGPAGLQNLCGRVAHGSVGSTPAPLRRAEFDASTGPSYLGQGSAVRATPPGSPDAALDGAWLWVWPSCCRSEPEGGTWQDLLRNDVHQGRGRRVCWRYGCTMTA